MLTEADRAEIAALVQEALAGQAEEGVRARPAAPARRPLRVGRTEGAAGGERPSPAPADGLAELGRSLAELRRELTERLERERLERERLDARLRQALQQAGSGAGEVPGIPPLPQGTGPQAAPSAAHGGAAGGGGGLQATGPGPGQAQRAVAGQPPNQGNGSPAPGGAGEGQDPTAAHKLAQANFDLAEALNDNLRTLKEIVDRSQELVARIEAILRRHAGGRQGA